MSSIVIELSECTLCGVCISSCPEVFRLNDAGSYIEAREMENYPVEAVDEAIRNCPARCIGWGNSSPLLNTYKGE